MKPPRLMLRIRKGLRRLDFGARPELQPTSPDRAWHEMLARLDAEEAERRLEAMEAALNGGMGRQG
ncbi:hypothetical protein PRN20_01930 [Devosia sp. ZB163]|uniref:hypothetical protein n=1 Tax=Devosia sp. ZB163 TaxID=3025938 RepID=UPI0023616868|nr:hypothetical protein [Devosia sp. ZB163]MDC9822478.1 hypothetical protein [Devosia sp. ZB163]